MSTTEDFENAPVGATATREDGRRAMKLDKVEWRWVLPNGRYLSDKEMVYLGFTLDQPAPATAREALALAWELGHEVKEGRTIPEGTRYLEVTGSGLREYVAQIDFEVVSWLVGAVRTVEPLSDPEPDWMEAPAVVAFVKGRDGGPQVFARGNEEGTQWVCDTKVYYWTELIGAVPLYPREDARPLPTRDEIADAIWGAMDEVTGEYYPYDQADAVLALLKEQDA